MTTKNDYRKVNAKCLSINLCSVPADYGQGANDGAYYPVGLMTIASHLNQTFPEFEVRIVDFHHKLDYCPDSDIVGISASSTLNYRNVLSLAREAKSNGSIVILGGPHVTQLPEQVLKNQPDLIDYVIRGNGEVALERLLKALLSKSGLSEVPSLSWRNSNSDIIHNPLDLKRWNYEDFLPFDMSNLNPEIGKYWETFQSRIDQDVAAAFIVFTHFGCGYREYMMNRPKSEKRISNWCSYCSLNERLSSRRGKSIVEEVLYLLRSTGVSKGSNVLLKCYGDNVGTHSKMLEDLALAIRNDPEWNSYNIGWTFYCQSSRLSLDLIDLLIQVGTKNLYIGFDSVDDEVQKLNGLGTSLSAHKRAVRLCRDANIKIQAGFVLGCAGESRASVEKTVKFAEELAEQGVLERINSAILFIIPGSPAYHSLCECEPWIRDLDELPTEKIQALWIKHFCPDLGSSISKRFEVLKWGANRLDELSPGPHASMGFLSKRLISQQERPVNLSK